LKKKVRAGQLVVLQNNPPANRAKASGRARDEPPADADDALADARKEAEDLATSVESAKMATPPSPPTPTSKQSD
jgi:hypothetical protein